MAFTPGLELSRRFFHDRIEPLLARLAPRLAYGAALIGDGSEVLGFDTPISTDHNWGPRVQIFVRAEDFAETASTVIPTLDQLLPREFMGWPVNFRCDRRPTGVDLEAGAAGSPAHGVEMHTLAGWTARRLGAALDGTAALELLDWLSIPEPILLFTVRGAVFRDDLGELAALRDQLAWFPRDVWLFKLASQWARIAEEIAFVGRAGDVGDDLGSRVIAARLVHEAMRLAFLIERRYAPYAKWFGHAFTRLDCAPALQPELVGVVEAANWTSREAALGRALMLLTDLQRRAGVTAGIEPAVAPYYNRQYRVVNAGEIALAIFEAIGDPVIRALPRTGAVDQFVDSTPVLTNAMRTRTIAAVVFGGAHPT
jgi:hypothetical protein